ncbi:MAG TPA: YbhB/YbcL family Raf kinase inhibitor-like protein [Candidatus Limnocylindria bacterium]|nr:YbhB/YbcL family Raf kinase inhibitor-like protein [Candidatus Limnocylindria bacterium]
MMRSFFVCALAVLVCAGNPRAAAAASSFTLSSATFPAGGTIPLTAVYDRSGCAGRNVSPELRWTGAPAETKSFALVVFDPKANRGLGWYHWLAFDIPVQAHELPAGAGDPGSPATPHGIVFGRNDFGSTAYGGPCPPIGDGPHPYQFTLYALNVAHLPVSGTTTGIQVGDVLRGHILAHATYEGSYGR